MLPHSGPGGMPIMKIPPAENVRADRTDPTKGDFKTIYDL